MEAALTAEQYLGLGKQLSDQKSVRKAKVSSGSLTHMLSS